MTRCLTLAEFWFLAEQIAGVDAAALINASPVDLVDSALHAPQAGFGDTDFYRDLHDKAAVLACRIAWNHPLPNGNMRAAWACLVMLIDINDGAWSDERPDTDDPVEAMLDVAAHDADETWLASWLRNASTSKNEPQRRATITRIRSAPAHAMGVYHWVSGSLSRSSGVIRTLTTDDSTGMDGSTRRQASRADQGSSIRVVLSTVSHPGPFVRSTREGPSPSTLCRRRRFGPKMAMIESAYGVWWPQAVLIVV